MPSAVNADALQRRLAELLAEHKVPGAALGVLADDQMIEVAAGIVNKNTGIEATPDTVFQIGSITKVWTATLIMMLVDEGLLDLDTPVTTYLPEFRVADAGVTKKVTLRSLLSHSSGIGGDHILETGRGDDTLERYVETCAELGQEHDLGATMSYCNTGYSVAGRIIEKITGEVWDQVLRERLIAPLQLGHTNTLPEEAILFRVAVGHVTAPGEEDPQVAPFWVLPRSAGPAGLINSTVADLLAFARLHLDEGRAPDGTQLLSVASVKQMQEGQIDVPDRFTLGDRWGLGWILFNWDGHPVYGHDGNTVGQAAFLRVLPEARMAVCLLTNGGRASRVFEALCGELVRDVASVTMPVVPSLPEVAPELDLSLYEGTFRRLNVELELTADGTGALAGTYTTSGPLAEMLPEDQRVRTVVATPVDRTLFLVQSADEPTVAPVPLVFFDFEGDRPKRLHSGARAMTRS